MTEEKVVSINELENIKRNIDEIIVKKSTPLPSFKQIQMKHDETDLREKAKEVFKYIKNNPNIIKEDLVRAFENRLGYSKKPMLNIIRELVEDGMIVVRPDNANSRLHHLFINSANELVSLTVDVDSFKQAYFDLIDNLNSLAIDKHMIFAGVLGLRENANISS